MLHATGMLAGYGPRELSRASPPGTEESPGTGRRRWGHWVWAQRPVIILLIFESSQVPETQVAESNERDADQTSEMRQGVSSLTKWKGHFPRGKNVWRK